jgi:hypothetical protein
MESERTPASITGTRDMMSCRLADRKRRSFTLDFHFNGARGYWKPVDPSRSNGARRRAVIVPTTATITGTDIPEIKPQTVSASFGDMGLRTIDGKVISLSMGTWGKPTRPIRLFYERPNGNGGTIVYEGVCKTEYVKQQPLSAEETARYLRK